MGRELGCTPPCLMNWLCSLQAAGGSEHRSVLGRGQLLRRPGLRVTVGGL